MKRNDHRLGGRKMVKQGRKINKMLDFVNVDDVGPGYFRANVSQKVSTRIIQSTNDLPAILSRVFLFMTDPRAPENTGSPMSCIGISGVLNNRDVVRMFVAHQHP
jgi:hypothetical protein